MVSKNAPNSKHKIAQHFLIGGVAVGISGSILRLTMAFIAMLNLPLGSNANHVGQSPTSFMSIVAAFAFTVTPYAMAFGAVSAFLCARFFASKGSRGIFVGWGTVMTLYLVASVYFGWL